MPARCGGAARPDRHTAGCMTSDEQAGDDRIEISSYPGAFGSTHVYVKVDGVEVHRVLTEAGAARLNREKRRYGLGSGDYSPGETYQGFDSEEDAIAAGRAVLADEGRTGLESDWPRHLVHRVDGAWTPLDPETYWATTPNPYTDRGAS